MKDLKTLISDYEAKRVMRERAQMAIALVGGVILLGGVTLSSMGTFAKKEMTPEPAAPVKTVYDDLFLSAKAAIVYDLTTGETLYAKNAEAQLPLASLTKLLTLYAAAEALEEDTQISMSAQALSADGDNGFTEGEVFTFEELSRMAIVASSNDAAAAIASAAADARHATNGTALLASAVSSLGLTQTYALNGTGLDENGTISGAYGSAHDIAILAGEFLKRAPAIAKASLESRITAHSVTGRSYTLTNTNPEVDRVPGLLLSKTGYTDLAGGNLAIVFDAGINHPVAVVVLGSTRENRFIDVERLVEATAAQFAGLSLP